MDSILSRKRPGGDDDGVAARRAEVERRISAATVDLLGDGRAFAEITVGEIATRSGISRSAFYTHFADKRELILSLADDATQPLVDAHVRAFPAGDRAMSCERVKTMLHVVAGFYRETRHVARAVFEAGSYDRVVREWWDSKVAAILAAFTKQAELDREAGRLTLPDGIDPRIPLYALHWMVHETLYQELIQHNRFEYDDVIDALARFIVRSFYGHD